MSIRDELAAVIRSKYDQHPVDRYPTEHALADWVLARFDVVELPKPHLEYGEDTPAAQWSVRGNGYALVRNDLTIVVGFRGAASPDEARQMAAALLAAANRAEASRVDS